MTDSRSIESLGVPQPGEHAWPELSQEGNAVSRREAIGKLAVLGAGAYAMLNGLPLRAQTSAGPVTTPPPDPRFPKPAPWPTELRKLGNNVYAYVQAGGPGLGTGGGVSNSGIIVDDDHYMVIDTTAQDTMVKDLKTRVRAVIGDKPCGRVVNTHQHADHVAGNQFFMPVEIVGHPFCRESVITMAKALAPDAKWPDGTPRKLYAPTTTFTDSMTYFYGGTEVRLLHLGIAHTWGDVVVHIPEYKVLIAADLAFFGITPFAHQGVVSDWIDFLDKLMAMDDIETIVPGHGPIGGKAQLAETREYFTILKREARKRFDAGMSPGKAAADIKMGKYDNWLGADRNLLNTFRLYCEFDGTITPLLDLVGMKKATDEYNAILASRA